MVRSLQRELSL